jgi:hypothetical protein
VNRRGFLRSILAAGVAPFVCTTAGVLMPVRDLWKPAGLLTGVLGRVEGFDWLGPEGIVTLRDTGLEVGDLIRIADPNPDEGLFVVVSVHPGMGFRIARE